MAQVPYDNRDDGLFFVEHTDFVLAFVDFQVSYYEDGYLNSWTASYKDNGEWKRYEFEVTQEQEMYISAELYMERQYMYQTNGCKNESTNATIAVYREDSPRMFLGSALKNDDSDKTPFFYDDKMRVGTYSVWVKIDWGEGDMKDYTLRIYSPSQIQIKKTQDEGEQTKNDYEMKLIRNNTEQYQT